MLDLNRFTSAKGFDEGLTYHGANEYTITDSGRFYGYTVYVTPLDDDGNAIPYAPFQKHAASSVSTAIAIIEAIENGEEV